jgi:hypothetical protein
MAINSNCIKNCTNLVHLHLNWVCVYSRISHSYSLLYNLIIFLQQKLTSLHMIVTVNNITFGSARDFLWPLQNCFLCLPPVYCSSPSLWRKVLKLDVMPVCVMWDMLCSSGVHPWTKNSLLASSLHHCHDRQQVSVIEQYHSQVLDMLLLPTSSFRCTGITWPVGLAL